MQIPNKFYNNCHDLSSIEIYGKQQSGDSVTLRSNNKKAKEEIAFKSLHKSWEVFRIFLGMLSGSLGKFGYFLNSLGIFRRFQKSLEAIRQANSPSASSSKAIFFESDLKNSSLKTSLKCFFTYFFIENRTYTAPRTKNDVVFFDWLSLIIGIAASSCSLKLVERGIL